MVLRLTTIPAIARMRRLVAREGRAVRADDRLDVQVEHVRIRAAESQPEAAP